MNKTDEYLNYTEYTHVAGGYKKLAFIIRHVQEYASEIKPAQVRILELGCGIGNITIPLASIGYDVVGIDMMRKVFIMLVRRTHSQTARS